MANLSEPCPPPVDIGKLNLSEYEFHISNGNDSNQVVLWETLAKSSIYALVFALALVGNLMVIFAVICNQHMRTTINYYLVNLAIADLAIALFCMWTHLVKHLAYPNFILGHFMCRVDAFIHMTSLTCNVLTMMAISCDRFFAIMCPLRARFTKQRASCILSVIWFVSIASSVPFIFHREYVEIKWKNYVQPQCGDVWPPKTHYDNKSQSCMVDYPTKRLYYTFFSVAVFFLPITVMSVTYTLLIRKLWLSHPLGEQSGATVKSIQSRTKKKVIKLVVILLLAFVICWMPLQLLTLYGIFGHVAHDQGHLPLWFNDVEFAAYFIAYSNSAANPVIYCGLNNNFRRGITNMLLGLCIKPTQSNSIKNSKQMMNGCDASRRRDTQTPKNLIKLSTIHKSIEVDV